MNVKALQERANLYRQIRSFFYQRDVMEIDAPALSTSAISDVHIESVGAQTVMGERYLHTSPEFYLKRCLVAGSGDIYSLGSVFRDEEEGHQHRIEFTMLEWYRLGLTLEGLMNEVAELIESVLAIRATEFISYSQAFERWAGIDVVNASAAELKLAYYDLGGAEVMGVEEDDRALWEQLILTEHVEPRLGQDRMTFLTHFPARQAALAKVKNGWAQRFELYINGVELANGYDELQDENEHRRRFELDQQERAKLGRIQRPLDEAFLNSLEQGLPECCGVALGVDRLLMLKMKAQHISEVRD